MSGFEVLLIIMAVVYLALGWLPRNVSRSDRLNRTIFACWGLGVLAVIRVYGENDLEPFLILSILFVLVWFGSILWLPRHSQTPMVAMSPLKQMLLGISMTPIFLIPGLLDREHQMGWFGLMFFSILSSVHKFIVRSRTESKTLTPSEH